eukprot:3736082-Amphidinium_carterae.1
MDKAAAANLFQQLYLHELTQTPCDPSGAAARAALQFSVRGRHGLQEIAPVRADGDNPPEANVVQSTVEEPSPA